MRSVGRRGSSVLCMLPWLSPLSLTPQIVAKRPNRGLWDWARWLSCPPPPPPPLPPLCKVFGHSQTPPTSTMAAGQRAVVVCRRRTAAGGGGGGGGHLGCDGKLPNTLTKGPTPSKSIFLLKRDHLLCHRQFQSSVSPGLPCIRIRGPKICPPQLVYVSYRDRRGTSYLGRRGVDSVGPLLDGGSVGRAKKSPTVKHLPNFISNEKRFVWDQGSLAYLPFPRSRYSNPTSCSGTGGWIYDRQQP